MQRVEMQEKEQPVLLHAALGFINFVIDPPDCFLGMFTP